MASQAAPAQSDWTIADLFHYFGPMPLRRIRPDPVPGTATEQDVLDLHRREKRLYELVEGVLVEKVIGFKESALACALIQILRNFLAGRKLGTVTGADGMLRLAPHLVRIPDVAFIAWDRLPNRRLPDTPIPDVAPDLAVEVLSESNTAEEMKRKLRDYFQAGTRVVWLVDPQTRSVQVYTSPGRSKLLRENQMLDGGKVLPGFSLSLRDLFAELAEQ
jgi:Uma2 family endonuclease